jgi:ferredoxin
MEKTFFSSVLLYDGSGSPALAGRPVYLRPGKSFHLQDTSEKVFLAGGFPDHTPKSSCVLSPTLQLNCDLGNFSDSELKLIAQAELNRFNASTFRSYTREPDTRVAVLAGKSSLLDDFLEIYGGIVHAEPLLLKGYDASYPAVEELRISPLETGYRLSYTVRTPVDMDTCTYCGLCGPACEEDCLSEDLFLDLSRCSFCKKCITVCPFGAIDLYRAEKRSLDIPAVILLGSCDIELPEEKSRIFTEDALDHFLANLAALRVDETVSCNPYICQYISRLDAGCDACVQACPQNAVIQTGAGITVKHELCIECGSCVSSCPTGAMQYELFDDQCFIEWFAKVEIPQNCTVLIGDEKQLHSLWWKKNLPENAHLLFLEHPNFKALTSMHFLFLLSVGAGRVILIDEPDSVASLPVAREIRAANTVFSSLFAKDDRVLVAAGQRLATLVQDPITTPFSGSYRDFNFTNRREKLASVLCFLMERKTVSADETAVLKGPDFAPFGTVSCDTEKCTHCGACLNECRILALTADEENLTLNLLGINCIQCTVCVRVCPENALALQPGLQLEADFFAPRELTRAEAVICPECGKPFGTRKSFALVMAKLKAHGSLAAENTFFEYCEKCRVVKLFESQQQ